MDMFPVKQSKHFSLLKLSWGLAHVLGQTDSEEGQEGTEKVRGKENSSFVAKKKGVGLRVGPKS
jgi:hypothetical protein